MDTTSWDSFAGAAALADELKIEVVIHDHFQNVVRNFGDKGNTPVYLEYGRHGELHYEIGLGAIKEVKDLIQVASDVIYAARKGGVSKKLKKDVKASKG